MHHSVSALFTISLLCSTSYLHAEITELDCGKGYDSYKGEVKERLIKENACQTIPQSSCKTNVELINDYQSLIALLEIPVNKNMFKNYLVKKLLDDPHINHYTLTIAYYDRIDLFKKRCTTEPDINETNSTLIHKKYGDKYITDVITGAKHIILYHIPTQSKRELERIKKLCKQVKTSAQLQILLKNLHKEGKTIIIKEWLDSKNSFADTAELEKSFLQSQYFAKSIQKLAHPYRYQFKDILSNSKDKKLLKKKKDLKLTIFTILTDILRLNDYHFYRRHSKTFLPVDQRKKHSYYKEIERLNKLKATLISNYIPSKIFSKKQEDLNIPKRYAAPLPDSPEQALPPRIIKFVITNFTSKIDPEKELDIHIANNIDILQKGNLLRISDRLKVIYQNKTYNSEQRHILIDTYVNYPGLYIDQISSTYGDMGYHSTFDKYENNFNTTGKGIIKKAECKYNLLAKKKDLTITCKIIYRPVKITFKHIEER